jgi:hypothetical protein
MRSAILYLTLTIFRSRKMTVEIIKEWFDEKEVASLTGISLFTLRNWRVSKSNISFTKAGKKSVRYRVRDVYDFMEKSSVKCS